MARLDQLIAPGGAVALVNTDLHDLGALRWHAAFEELRREHGRFDAFYHWRKSEAWEEHTSVLLRSAFSEVERISVFEAHSPDLEEIVARALSFSANSPAALGEAGRTAYEPTCAHACWRCHPSKCFPRSSRASPSSRDARPLNA